jgi:hypothetical protein
MYILEKGAVGLSVLVITWQLIYSNDGYYIDYNKDLLLLIKKRINVDTNIIDECIKTAVSRGIFDSQKYSDYSILTSKAIQKRYFKAASRKKEISVARDYILDESLLTPNCKRVNVNKNPVNVNNNYKIVSGNATKVKEEVKEEVKEKKKINKKKSVAKQVSLKQTEIDTLIQKHGKKIYDKAIDKLSNYKQSKGKKYKSDYAAINLWVIRAVYEDELRAGKNNKVYNEEKKKARW